MTTNQFTVSLVTYGTAAALSVAPFIAGHPPRPSAEVPRDRIVRERPLEGGYPTHTTGASFISVGSGTFVVFPEAQSSHPISADSFLQRAIMERTTHLRALRDGWLGEDSRAPSGDILDWVYSHASMLAQARQEIALIPLSDGSLSMSWAEGGNEFTAELQSGQRLYLFVDHADTEEFDESDGDLTEERLFDFLRNGIVT